MYYNQEERLWLVPPPPFYSGTNISRHCFGNWLGGQELGWTNKIKVNRLLSFILPKYEKYKIYIKSLQKLIDEDKK